MTLPQAERNRLERERTIDLDRYREDGCNSRVEYLEGLAENEGLELSDILELVDLMGPEEDFDGLVTSLEDHGDTLREIAA